MKTQIWIWFAVGVGVGQLEEAFIPAPSLPIIVCWLVAMLIVLCLDWLIRKVLKPDLPG
jgi:hypothetical protein